MQYSDRGGSACNIAFDLELLVIYHIDRDRLCEEVYLEQRAKKVACCGFWRITWFGARSCKIGDRCMRKLQEHSGKALRAAQARLDLATILVFAWREVAEQIHIPKS